jgi:AcrR family transcriptional regulator
MTRQRVVKSPKPPKATEIVSEKRPRGRPRSDKAHQAILDSALELLGEVGYDALTIEGIAGRAGVGKKTVYRRWASKDLIVADAFARPARDARVPDTGSTEDDLLALMRDSVRVYNQPANAQFIPGLVAAIARSPAVAEAVRAGQILRRRAAIREVLERGVERGDLRADMDRDLALDFLGGPLFYRLLVTGGPIDERLARGIVDAMLRGFQT